MQRSIRLLFLALLTLLLAFPAAGLAQEPEEQPAEESESDEPLPPLPSTAVLEVEPAELTLEVGEKAELKAVIRDGDEMELEVELITPIAMEKTMRFAIREGGRTVGAGRVADILD